MSEKSEQNEGTGLEIAVIGMAGRFPGASDIENFWENIKMGKEAISFFSDEELAEEGGDSHEADDPAYVRARGVLEEVENFDPAFFKLTPGEADVMDPQLRIFMECSWQALEDAGYNPDEYDGDIGVYAGNAVNHYWIAKTMFSKKARRVGMFKTELLNTHFSMRVSYHLNLKGPSLTIQTACSTSLAAIHTACVALLSSECDMALTGGASLSLPQKAGYLYEEGMVNSPDGHCRSFDSRAKGAVAGSGAGAVVLKRLEDAVDDGDFIYAVVKGTAINNDGLRKVGYTAPSVIGQADAVRAAYLMAEVEPETVSYIETHGSATELGDPVEIEALNMVFHKAEKNSIPIGSVKTNVGHLDTAAGVTGFIKAVLALKNGLIPASLYFETPNPKIDFENSPFYVNTRLHTPENLDAPLRAGVSSFGLGGTNAHVVLEKWNGANSESSKVFWGGKGGDFSKKPPLPPEAGEPQLILLSARTPAALERMTGNFVNYLEKNPGTNLKDAAYTLQKGRKSFPYRKAVPAAAVEEAVQLLSGKSKKVKTYRCETESPGIVFLLSGQGAQYVGMGLDLYRKVSYFRQEVDRCFAIVKDLTGADLKEIIYPELSEPGTVSTNSNELASGPTAWGSVEDPAGHLERTPGNRSHKPHTSHSAVPGEIPSSGFIGAAPRMAVGRGGLAGQETEISQTAITQPLIFSFGYALAALLIKWGIKPAAMLGYSMGEYIAACLSGVFSLTDALKIVTIRGQSMEKTGPGAMLSVPLPHEELEPLMTEGSGVYPAIFNGPTTVIAGSEADTAAFEKQLQEKRLLCAPINISHAVHTPLMEPVRREFENRMKEIKMNEPQIPFISNVSGDWISAAQAADPSYWGTHLCSPVRFSTGIKELLKQENTLFIEIGPGRLLSNIVRHHVLADKEAGHKIVNIIKHQQEKVADDDYLLGKIAEMWGYGITIDWDSFHPEEEDKPKRVPLPGYPFDRKRHWIDEDPFQGLAEWQNRTGDKPGFEEPEPEPAAEPAAGEDEDQEYDAPRDELESAIAKLWQEFLGFERIGREVDFFDINGDSITATHLVTRLQKLYPVEISLQQFFETPTIAGQAKLVKELLIAKVKGLSDNELDDLV